MSKFEAESRKLLEISIFLLIFQTKSFLANQCTDPTDGQTRAFNSLSEYQKNVKPFNPMNFEEFQGNYVEIKLIKPNLEQNDFLAFESSYIIRLDLSEKKITSLENNTFYSLTCLRHLNLAKNKILDINPGSFRGLQWLGHLNLSYNNLQSLPDLLFQNLTQIKDLDLSNNQLSMVSSTNFQDLPILQHLNLSHNKLTYIDLDHLKVNTVSILDLSYNNLKTFDVSTTHFMQLTRLLLNNNHLIDLNMFSIKNQIPHLALLTLEENLWACDDLSYILKAMNDSRIFYNLNHKTERVIGGIDCVDYHVETTSISSSTESITIATFSTERIEALETKGDDLMKSVADLRSLVNCLIIFMVVVVAFEVVMRSGAVGWVGRIVRRSRNGTMYDDASIENIRLIPSSMHRV